MTTYPLPPLPECDTYDYDKNPRPEVWYAESIHAYARAAQAPLIEKIAELERMSICELGAINPGVLEYMRHWEGRAEKAEHERDKLKDVLLRNGFVECDIAACNCGSWHARYGLRERLDEINDALREADVLNNDTGNLALRAIGKLVEQRDALRAELAQCQSDRQREHDARCTAVGSLEALRERVKVLEGLLLQVARMAEALKRPCSTDPESQQAIRNGEYMNISYTARAALAAKEPT